MSDAPTLIIDLKNLTRVKRSSLANGLKVHWTSVDNNGNTSELEERFLWVVGRDDLFARLVGSQSRQWRHR
jgi:GRAM domain-containing protein 4